MGKIETLINYQEAANATSQFSKFGITLPPLVYFALGLAGESGEVLEKVKKLYRDFSGEVTPDQKALIIKELGDVLWYVSQISTAIGSDMQEIAQINIDKLNSRLGRDQIHGNGDER